VNDPHSDGLENRTLEPSVLIVVAPSAEASARLDVLRVEAAARPEDGLARSRLAKALVGSDPALALEHASAALELVPLDAPEARGVVLTLAEALAAAGMFEEVLGLAEACRERWPAFTELRMREALAYKSLGRTKDMLGAFEACLKLGEDPAAVGAAGAGSFLPWLELGLFAESCGDRGGARACYGRALGFGPFAPASERLSALDAAAASSASVPPRLLDNGAVAMKACRHGSLMYPVNDSFVGRALDLYGEWCESEIELFASLLVPGDVVVDVGANIGTHTVFFGKHVGPKGRVVALEPQRFVHGLLVANVAANGLANVDCLLAAASNEEGSVQIPVVDPRRACNFGAIGVAGDGAGAAGGGETEAVRATTIDALALERCALVKVDVEGLETLVLSGAARTIARTKPILFVENNTVERSGEVIRAVQALGYRAYWHIAPYFRSDNFFGNAEDVFAPYQPEANLVCVPVSRTLPGMLEVEGDGDDFVKALVRAGAMESRTVTGPVATRPRPRPVAVAVAGRAGTPRSGAAQPDPAKPAEGKTRPLTIVACIPGREFSGRFFDAWNEFAERCRAIGVKLIVSRRYDAVVYYARNRVAGGDVRRGPKQAPWGGEIDYDYMLWIDSDVVFRFEDFQALLAHKVDMVGGLYLMADNTRYAAVEHMDEALFQKQGEFEFLTPAKLASRTGLVPVDYCGFGFVLVRRGIFEKLEYPWFRPLYIEIGGCSEFTSEDVGFCLMAKKAGLQMMIDPDVVVGHEKAVVLAPPPRKAA
jgi:FkbM family methyltransferase